MTVWTFLSVLSNVFSKEKLVAEEHNGPCRAVENSLWIRSMLWSHGKRQLPHKLGGLTLVPGSM